MAHRTCVIRTSRISASKRASRQVDTTVEHSSVLTLDGPRSKPTR